VGLGECRRLPHRRHRCAPAEVDFGAFYPLNVISGGKIFNDFPENQLLKFHSLSGRLGGLRSVQRQNSMVKIGS